jgi:hypothetical protein
MFTEGSLISSLSEAFWLGAREMCGSWDARDGLDRVDL